MTLLAKWRAWLCARLIDDWHRAYTFSSIRLAAIGALIEAFVQAFPGTASEIWNAMPQDLRVLLPAWVTGSFPAMQQGRCRRWHRCADRRSRHAGAARHPRRRRHRL